MSASPSERGASLIVVAGACTCAIPVAHVVETMRPLPVEAIAGAASFLLGLSVIRGTPVPVVDLQAVIGGGSARTIFRFVALSVGERKVALAVREILGLRELDGACMTEMPPLLREAHADVIEAIGVLDAQLLLVLRASRLLSDEIWLKISTHDTPS
jgi:purine-binding chemotaxis protein CheW